MIFSNYFDFDFDFLHVLILNSAISLQVGFFLHNSQLCFGNWLVTILEVELCAMTIKSNENIDSP